MYHKFSKISKNLISKDFLLFFYYCKHTRVAKTTTIIDCENPSEIHFSGFTLNLLPITYV